ncbi:MAG TPA: Sua5/YciO/YrdC/YwlC family protein, partial [Pyrinomonadaceae bacterium]|nr:Sua5/YciO/YrdC/YwlC family protein [Pyrinomonadaceae bacterium]
MPTLPDSPETRRRAAEIAAAGGVVAFRTDTFYGLGADPFNADALRAIFRLKGRDEGKPVLVVVADEGDAERLVAARTALFDALVSKFWPGPLTLVAAARAEL